MRRDAAEALPPVPPAPSRQGASCAASWEVIREPVPPPCGFSKAVAADAAAAACEAAAAAGSSSASSAINT